MEEQNKIVLSIGSNQGDRKSLIQQAIDTINREVATVVSVSKLYESLSWGFESEPFYNCAILVHTSKSASKILKALLNIEKKLGRIRTEETGYKSRTIDIDIISFNNDIIETEVLNVPHPQMQNRMFVLVPMKDLQTEFFHPISKQNIQELIANCPDKSECRCIDSIENPFKNKQINNYNFIAIEGNIGAGKTTLAHKIADDFNAKKILERFADNPFLPKFYKD